MINKVSFKSAPEMFEKEHSGRKPNTIRQSDGGIRFDFLNKFMDGELEELDIRIYHSEDVSQFFDREINDVTLYQGWYIISW